MGNIITPGQPLTEELNKQRLEEFARKLGALQIESRIQIVPVITIHPVRGIIANIDFTFMQEKGETAQ